MNKDTVLFTEIYGVMLVTADQKLNEPFTFRVLRSDETYPYETHFCNLLY